MGELKEALYYEKLDDKKTLCRLCPHQCRLGPGQYGICRVRNNIEGTLYTHNYGKISAIAMDPVEKKPLYHFFPGKYLLSLGTVGCNFRCKFCQNYRIAQRGTGEKSDSGDFYEASEGYILSLCRQEEDCVGIAYTYNEPSVWYEYILDMAKYVKSKGYRNVLVTNGYMSDKPLMELLPYIDAMNIDVKSFNEEYYKDICGGRLEFVKNTVEAASSKCHIEITTLIVPGLNDSEEEMEELSEWLASVKPSIPLHLSRYFPMYMMNENPTPVETLKTLKKAAMENLEYVYIGNVSGNDTNTYCPDCGALLVRREDGIFIEHLDEGTCTKCGKLIDMTGV
ncbi:MAG: AmmeMemoRadiSam system radical SAM enzyme [Caulobacteraceae bacterium]